MENPISIRPAPTSTRARNAKWHKPDCLCTLCKRIQAAIDAGKPSKSETRAVARLAREQRRQAREKSLSQSKRARGEERRIKAALVQGAMAGQVASGVIPSIEKAAQIAGVSVQTARNAAPKDLVEDALERNGITDDKLYGIASEGLEAKIYKIVTDRDGNVVEKIELPDWQNRHRFWRDILMVKGHLGSDRDMPATGGLMIILPEQAHVVPGHPPTCNCDTCIAAWNERTKEMSGRALRSMAIDAETAKSKDQPETRVDEAVDLEDDTDDS